MILKNRTDIEDKYKWDLKEYFSNEESFKNELASFCEEFKKMETFNGKLTDKGTIFDCMQKLDKLNATLERLYVYASVKRDEDVAVDFSQERYAEIRKAATDFDVACSFIMPQLSTLSDEFLNDISKDAKFEEYSKIFADIIREKSHILSEKEEKLLSNVSTFSSDFKLNFSNFEDADLKFFDVENAKGEKLPMSQSSASIYLTDNDAVLRKNAFCELNGAFGRYNNFLTSNYIASVKKDVFYAKVRGFSSALEKALFYEEVDEKVYNQLIENVNKYLNLEHKFFELKRRLMKTEQISVADMRINPVEDIGKSYTFEEGFDIVCDALSVLGEEYVNNLKMMRDCKKIDVMPNKNKHTGAYMTSAYGCPPLVLTNFMGKYNDISTLAHELGHAMHSYNSDKNQPINKAGYTIFLAEIASTVNECLLNKYMLDKAQTKEEKIYYLNEFLTTFHATVFRQTMFAEFEDKTHKLCESGAGISTSVVNNLYLDLVKRYFGKDVKIYDEIKYEWSRIPHFFSAFYVYKYSTGLISAISICNNILKNGESARQDYMKFLSLGGSMDPLSILQVAGVDLKNNKSFEDAFAYFENYLNMLEELI